MDETRQQQMTQCLAAVLETFGFMFAEGPVPVADLPGGVPDPRLVRMSCRGPSHVTVTLAAPPEFCRTLAANVLGLEALDSPDAGRFADDTLKELLNVVGNRLVTESYGTQAEFEFGIPELQPCHGGTWAAFAADAATLAFLVEGQPLLFALCQQEEEA